MRPTPKQIADMLADRAEEVCMELYPNGKRKGREWILGDDQGGDGNSFRIVLEGHKKGLCKDFASGDKGFDLLDAWQRSKGQNLPDAMRSCCEFLGISLPGEKNDIFGPTKSRFDAPGFADCERLDPVGPVFAYLHEKRELPAFALEAYKVGQTVGGSAYVFPYYPPEPDRKPTALKYVALERNEKGKKKEWTSKNSEWHLFGWRAIPADAREVVITEGEIDAISVWAYGYPALSVPLGIGNLQWIDTDFDALARFDTIYLAVDMDEHGQSKVKEISKRLGIERVRVVQLPKKDANECLQSGMSKEDFEDCLKNAIDPKPPEVKGPLEFAEEVETELYPPQGIEPGTPFFLGEKFNLRIRNGELTIWTGFSNHGKSPCSLQQVVSDISNGQKAFIVSLEIPPRKSLAMMLRQCTGGKPMPNELNATLGKLDGRLWLLDRVGSFKWRELLPILEYVCRRHGVTRIVIDSLLLLGISGDDYDQQRTCVQSLEDLAKKEDCHIHLIAHSKKLDDETRPPGKFDVKGSGDITDLAHNGITVWRNITKERILKDPAAKPGDKSNAENSPDVKLSVWKQRETGEHPYAGAWLDKESYQLLDTPNTFSRKYL